MTIYQRMAAIFDAAGIPGFLQEWRATDEYPEIPEKYCTYLLEQETDAMCADDREIVHSYRIWIDAYGQTDLSEELQRLNRALDAAGFCIPYTRDMDNLRLSRYQYHRRLRVDYYEYLSEED